VAAIGGRLADARARHRVVMAATTAAGPAVGAAVPGLKVFAVTFTGLVGAMVVLAVAVVHLCDGACYKLIERLVVGGLTTLHQLGSRLGDEPGCAV
jgi:nitrate/nitrite transporter NarK